MRFEMVFVWRFLRCFLVLGMLFGLGGALSFGQGVTAFPGAEGAGKWSVGGRGGRVIAVTNLRDSGVGSLRAAVEASGRRTVVFRVAGTIWLKSKLRVRNPFLTIAGQTAPGEGITVAGHEFQIMASDVVLRYLRFRPGPGARADVDAVHVMRGERIILDHLSLSWAVDEVLSVTPDARDVTVQWCLISESLHRSVHSSGRPHGKGVLIRGRDGARVSLYRNLLAHHADRAPMLQGMDPVVRDSQGVWVDFRNNVVYDWGSVTEGWEAAGANRNRDATARSNFVNNAYLAGPGTAAGFLPVPQFPYFALRFWAFEELSTHARAHWAGNTFNGELWRNGSNQLDPTWRVSVPAAVAGSYFLPLPVGFSGAEVPMVGAVEATSLVLNEVGASRRRDGVDLRVIQQVVTGGGGIIDKPGDVGGWPVLAGGAVARDTDGDGLPDDWERARGLDPRNGRDGARVAAFGRTWLELFHEELLQDDAVEVVTEVVGPGSVGVGQGRVGLGAGLPLELVPAAGYVVEGVWLNGRRLGGAEIAALGPLWGDAVLRVEFARPRVAFPEVAVGRYQAFMERDEVLNRGLGGQLSVVVSGGGVFTGTFRFGRVLRRLRGRFIAREQELPMARLHWVTASGVGRWLEMVLAGDGSGLEVRYGQGGDEVTFGGWRVPWSQGQVAVPEGWVGTFRAGLLRSDLPEEEGVLMPGQLRLVVARNGRVAVRAGFAPGRVILRSSWLGAEGQWGFWMPPGGRAMGLGRGRLLEGGGPNGWVERLLTGGEGVVVRPYLIQP